ncbi:hypothetical protein [Xanthomonas translucens]|uniref:hypothetical protein n=1 Tax=Xanthomonas campestris pv. translucens TaxID=343 RepID=UPI000AF363C1|nr:hypothetical protein [Xanthomonas translucens]
MLFPAPRLRDRDAAQPRTSDDRHAVGHGDADTAGACRRLALTTAVVNAAEKRHFAWAYWQFEGSFGVYGIGQGHWIEPLHRALVSRDGAYSRRRPPLGATGAKP